MADDPATEFYWCLRHQRVESTDLCPADQRMGPYPSPEAAERFAETAKSRNEDWAAEDERWHGE